MEHSSAGVAKAHASMEAGDHWISAAINTSIDAYILVNGQGRLLAANHATERIFRHSEPELLNLSVHDLIPRLSVDALAACAAGDREPHDRVERAVQSCGTEFPVHVMAGTATHEGEPAYVLVIHDMRVRFQIQAQLDRTQELLERAINGTTDGVWYVEIGGERRFYYSPRLREMMDLQDPNARVEDLMQPEHRAQLFEALERHYTHEDPTKPVTLTFTLNVRGEERWFQSRGMISRDEDGKPHHIAGSTSDITVSRKAQIALEETQQRLEQTVEELQRVRDRLELAISGTSDGIWEWDVAKGSLYESPRLREMLGLHEPGQTLRDLLNPELVETLREIYSSYAGQGGPFDHELPVTLLDGQRKWFRVRGTTAYDAEGKTVRMAGSVSDVTERRQAIEALQEMTESLTQRVHDRTADLRRANAELEKASRSKDAFLASMSHELRTPLNAILGLTEALTDEVYGPLNSDQKRALATVESSGKHLLALISDVLDLAKIHAGRMRLESDPTSVRDLVLSSIAYVRRHAEKAGLSLLVSDVDPGLVMNTDGRRLRQILINLLSNAVKFTPDGGRVHLEVHANAEQGVIEFRVEDTGIGIDPERQREIFEPFRQVDSKLSRNYDGTGLGLALVRELVDAFGGSIALDSQLGVGSTFSVFVPWVRPAPELRPTDESQELPKRVLIVEDNLADVEKMERALSEFNVLSLTVGSVTEIPAAIRAFNPEAILLDVILPGETGWEFLTHAKEVCGDIPVVVVSALDDPTISRAAGAAAHLTKPFSRMEIVSLLRSLSRNHDGFIGDLTTSARILLAEDNPANQTAMADYLRSTGLIVEIVSNGTEAVAASKSRPDLIVMDIQMPQMDGLEAIRHIRSSEVGRDIPIIAVTALAMRGDRDRCMAAGATDYLSKPVSLRDLRLRIDDHLRRVRSR